MMLEKGKNTTTAKVTW